MGKLLIVVPDPHRNPLALAARLVYAKERHAGCFDDEGLAFKTRNSQGHPSLHSLRQTQPVLIDEHPAPVVQRTAQVHPDVIDCDPPNGLDRINEDLTEIRQPSQRQASIAS
jgi:hypothetical protein